MWYLCLRRFCVLIFAVCVTACGGGGGGGSTDQLGSGGGNGVVDPGDLPVSGSARYDGFLTLGLPTPSGRANYTGQLGLDVDFDAADVQVTGLADNFATQDDETVTGRIIITDGVIDREADVVADYTFDADLSGTLSGPDFRNMVITGTMLGDFNGQDGEAITGRVFGDVILPTGTDIYNGTFSGTSD